MAIDTTDFQPSDFEPIEIANPDFKLEITFFNNTKNCGKLFVNSEGKLDFEGDITESARLFIDEVKRLFNQ